jgi:deoxyribose-phosphate aldolase
MMRSSLLPEIQIKAAGGIRSYAEALQLLQAGASRLGTSSGIKIIEEASKL